MRMIMNRVYILSSILFVFFFQAIFATPVKTISDDSTLRSSLVHSYFIETPSLVLKKKPQLFTLPAGEVVQVRVEKGRDEFLIILSREMKGQFPGWAEGSWVLYRKIKDGSPYKIRVFLRSDPYVYVQFRPFQTKKSLMDVVVYNGYVLQSVSIPFSFSQLYTMPLTEVFSTVREIFPFRYFDVSPDIYKNHRLFVNKIRNELPQLQYADDGALDETGTPVFIATGEPQGTEWGLNCSGFAKWVVDLIVKPSRNAYLPIVPLKNPVGTRGSGFTEAYEQILDPYFGLDWTRNLALMAYQELFPGTKSDLETIDVREVPISALLVQNGSRVIIENYPQYLPDAGFCVEGLPAILYTLAIDTPNFFYLASVNTVDIQKPNLRRHYHVAVLIPYFESDGDFRVAVFESAAETNLNVFVQRYPAQQVHLVRIPIVNLSY